MLNTTFPFILLSKSEKQFTRIRWFVDLTLADGVFDKILPFEEGYFEEHITDIPPIYHRQATNMLSTADHKVVIDTSTDVERVVTASID